MAPDPLARAVLFLDAIDAGETRVVVRWADESRLRPDGAHAYSVRPISYAILTAKIDGRALSERFEGIDVDALKGAIARRPLSPLYRCDNQTR